MDKSTYFQMESVSSPAISPDGMTVLFSRGYVDMTRDQNRSNLWMIGITGERLRQLTDGPWQDSSPVWSPDGKRIAFLSDRSGSSQLHVMWLDTRDSLQLTRLERAPGSITWSPDGKTIAFTGFVPDDSPILNVRLPEVPRGAQLARGATLVDRPSWASDGSGPTPRGFTHLFTIDASVGGTPSPGHDRQLQSLRAVVVRGRKDGVRLRDPEARCRVPEWRLRDLRGLPGRWRHQALDRSEGSRFRARDLADWKVDRVHGLRPAELHQHLSSLYMMDSAGGKKRLWVGSLPSSPSNVAWAPDGSGVYYSMQMDGEENTWFAPADQGLPPKKITNGVHVLSGITFAKNGQAVGVRSSFKQPGELVAFALSQPSDAEGARRREQRHPRSHGRWQTPKSCGSPRPTA
jgi:dipeptidyl aminopeptidase/acylaminoacyl peptidase